MILNQYFTWVDNVELTDTNFASRSASACLSVDLQEEICDCHKNEGFVNI